MVDVFVPLALAYLMFTVGLDVRPGDFSALIHDLRTVVSGLVAQMIGVPVIAFALASMLRLPPELAVGLIILAAAPGGVTSGFVTGMVRGDVALSVVLTVITSFASVFTVPLIVGSAMDYFTGATTLLTLPVGRTVAAIAVTVLAPLAIAIAVARRAPAWVERTRTTLRRIGLAIFIMLILTAIVAEWRTILSEAPRIGMAVVALNLAVMAFGLALSHMVGGTPARARAIVIECGLQNVALALLVTGPILHRPDLASTATVYALVMNLSALILIAFLRRTSSAAERHPR